MNESGSDSAARPAPPAPTAPIGGASGVRSRRCGRLRDSSDFGRVRASGRSWSSPLLVLQAAPGATVAVRVGFIVSKRIGKAVCRNRVRRLLREAMRRVCGRVRNGWDLVIVARSRIVGERLEGVQAALEDVLKRAGLLDGPPVATESPAGGFPFAGEPPSDRTNR